MIDPDDGTPMFQPSIAPNKWVEDYSILLPTIDQFCAANCDVKQQNPLGWQNIISFKRLALDYQSQVQGYMNKLKMQAAKEGQPPPPQPDPTVQQLEATALQDAMGGLQRLAQQGAMPPLGPSASIAAQVSANKELVDKVAKFLTTQ
jgi:hypothetical protein